MVRRPPARAEYTILYAYRWMGYAIEEKSGLARYAQRCSGYYHREKLVYTLCPPGMGGLMRPRVLLTICYNIRSTPRSVVRLTA